MIKSKTRKIDIHSLRSALKGVCEASAVCGIQVAVWVDEEKVVPQFHGQSQDIVRISSVSQHFLLAFPPIQPWYIAGMKT